MQEQSAEIQTLMHSTKDFLNQKDQIINQLRYELNSFQQQHEDNLRRIEELQEITKESIGALDQCKKEKEILIQVKGVLRQDALKHAENLELKTKSAAEKNAKFLEEKAKAEHAKMQLDKFSAKFLEEKTRAESAKTQLSNFIDSHPYVEDIGILVQIKEILGGSESKADPEIV